MKEFFIKNKSVFVVGTVTALIFIVLIILSYFKQTSQPTLSSYTIGNKEQTEEENKSEGNIFTQRTPTPANRITPNDPMAKFPGNAAASKLKSSEETNVDLETPTVSEPLIITYTPENGFIPRNANVERNRLVIWINRADSNITLVQKLNTYEDLKENKVIPAGGTFEYTFTKTGLWTYEELDTKAFGSLFITNKWTEPN